jgi:ketosteroid isomerase-like protein
MGQMTDRVMVSRWLADYEAAWRAPGIEALAEIFTGDAAYRHSPYDEPVAGLDAIKRMWDEERDGPEEVFTLATEILAVDGTMAVVRAEVRYGDPGPPGVPRPVDHADPCRRPLQLVRGMALLVRASLLRRPGILSDERDSARPALRGQGRSVRAGREAVRRIRG